LLQIFVNHLKNGGQALSKLVTQMERIHKSKMSVFRLVLTSQTSKQNIKKVKIKNSKKNIC